MRDPVTDQRTSIDDSWSALVGSVRLSYALVEDQVNLFGGISQGFRAPNLSDLTRFDTARSDEFEIPATDLDPEDAIQFELGVKADTERSSVQATTFYTLLEDSIVRFPTGNTNTDGDAEISKANVGDGYVWGLEFAGVFGIDDDWSVFAETTYLEGRVDTFPTSDPVIQREYIDRLMPWTSRLGLRYERGTTWAETALIYADRADRLSTRDRADDTRIPPGGTPSYVVWDIRSGWNVNEDVQVTLALENVLDEDYRIHGSGLNRPGRNLVVGLRFSF